MEIANYCWNKIGITGDKSCLQLQEVIHCRNCSVYSSAGRALFQREAPAGYLEDWTELLSQSLTVNQLESSNQKAKVVKESATSLIIFRLEEEWLALPVEMIKEITPVFTIHTLPHRSNHILTGIVNIRGEILICISLTNLLALKKVNWKNQEENSVTYPRMIVIDIKDNRWVFKVDELDSVGRFYSDDFQESPTALSKHPNTYTKKILTYKKKKVNYLDSELLFYELLFHTYSKPQTNLVNS